ncbi:DUF2946 family protein [Solilutibacter pythonis]|nr:DUF2946 family protein [Lysobacter pythonis]
MHRLRSPSPLTALALLAMLLLAGLPTLGRLYQSAQSGSPPVVALCTVEGLKQLAQPFWTAAGDTGQPHGAPAGERLAHDCEYCPLLAGLTVLVLLILGLRALAPASPLPLWRHARPALRRHPSGLGSRGPPIPL